MTKKNTKKGGKAKAAVEPKPNGRKRKSGVELAEQIAADALARGAKRKREKQTEIPGAEREVDPEMEMVGETWLDARKERRDATGEEKRTRGACLDLMAKKRIHEYEFEDGTTLEAVDKGTALRIRKPRKKRTKAIDPEVVA